MINRTSKYLEFISQLKRTGERYTVTHTNNSCSLECRFGKYFFSDFRLTGKELNFIKKFRNYFVKTPPQLKTEYLNHRANFFRVKKQPEGRTIKNVIELDINGAYFSAAKNLNYLPEELFKEGMTYSKKTRLVAIGTLARTRKSFYHDGHKYFEIPSSEDENTKTELKNFWKTIVNYTDISLHDVYFNSECYFYWVDAVFMNEFRAEEAKKIFAKHNFTVKEKKTDYIKFSHDRILVKAADDENERPFFLPQFDERMKKYLKREIFIYD